MYAISGSRAVGPGMPRAVWKRLGQLWGLARVLLCLTPYPLPHPATCAAILGAGLYFWQMPHFMALAWMCKADYAGGGRPAGGVAGAAKPQNERTAQTPRHRLPCAANFLPSPTPPSPSLSAAGGYRMLSLVDATGRRTAACALRNCLYLLPLGALATWLGVTTPYFAYESGGLPAAECLRAGAGGRGRGR